MPTDQSKEFIKYKELILPENSTCTFTLHSKVMNQLKDGKKASISLTYDNPY